MPSALAPSPQNGAAAPETPTAPVEGESAQAVNRPADHSSAAAARTVAVGVLLATTALLIGLVAVAGAAAIRLVASGHDRLKLDPGSAAIVLLLLGFAFADAAALVALSGRRHPLRPVTVIGALLLALGWPLSGFPLPAALFATLALALVLTVEGRRRGGARMPTVATSAALAVVAACLTGAGLAGAITSDVKHPLPSPVANSAAGTPEPGAEAFTGGTNVGSALTAPSATGPAASHETSTTPGHAAPAPSATPGAAGAAPSATATGPTTSHEATATPGHAAPAPSATPGAAGAAPSPTPGHAGPAPSAATGPATSRAAPATQHTATATPEGTPAAPAAHGAPAKPPTPSPASAGAPAVSPADFVRSYYRALGERRYTSAWERLQPAVQRRFGGFTKWRAGYATTVSNRPLQITALTPAAAGAVTVTNVLAARDSLCSDRAERRFNVTWRLVPAGSSWKVAALTATLSSSDGCR